MNGKTSIPALDGYDAGDAPTLSAWDEWDRDEAEEVAAWWGEVAELDTE